MLGPVEIQSEHDAMGSGDQGAFSALLEDWTEGLVSRTVTHDDLMAHTPKDLLLELSVTLGHIKDYHAFDAFHDDSSCRPKPTPHLPAGLPLVTFTSSGGGWGDVFGDSRVGLVDDRR